MLLAIGWVAYTNMDLLDSVTEAIRRTNREVTVKLEMQKVATYIRAEYVETNRLPRNPLQIIRTYHEANGIQSTSATGKDIWRSYYEIVPSKRGFNVISAGPDRRRGTNDDIRFHQSLDDLGYKGPIKIHE